MWPSSRSFFPKYGGAFATPQIGLGLVKMSSICFCTLRETIAPQRQACGSMRLRSKTIHELFCLGPGDWTDSLVGDPGRGWERPPWVLKL